jgi:hypothetical protein
VADLIITDDGKAIVQPREVRSNTCAVETFQKQISEVMEDVKETIWVSRPLFKGLKEGDEVKV